MYIVYEIGQRNKPYDDGKKFYHFESEDRFECEVYIAHHQHLANGIPVLFEIVQDCE